MKVDKTRRERPASAQTAPGVRLMRDLYDIETKKKPAEKAPESVKTDIYSIPGSKNNVPRRAHPNRR